MATELNEKRERWLNPPEWIEQVAAKVDAADRFDDVPEPARPLIRQSAIMAAAAKDARLKKRTLTNLYNERPTWLKLAHETLDRAVLAAYAAVDPDGHWSEDWSAVWLDTGAGKPLPVEHALRSRRAEVDQLVLANLLRLNQARAGASPASIETQPPRHSARGKPIQPKKFAPALREHDLVRATLDINRDGYRVQSGMVGTVVSVHTPGGAFGVEFPEIKDGPAVVTVQAGEIEPAGPSS